MKTVWTDKRLQQLFRKYNRLYWCSDLPKYSVIFTKDFNGARCEKSRRTIFINADIHESDKQLRADLLHEMAHAATNIGHGKLWKAEMDRIRNLGAPVSELDFQPGIGRKEILADFSDAAEQGLTWSQARSLIGFFGVSIVPVGANEPVFGSFVRSRADSGRRWRRSFYSGEVS